VNTLRIEPTKLRNELLMVPDKLFPPITSLFYFESMFGPASQRLGLTLFLSMFSLPR